MAKILAQILFYLSILVLTGCYSVPFLIEDESKAVINDVALGSWKSVKNTPYSKGSALEITREEDSPWYRITYTDLTTGKADNLKAIVHEVGNRLVLSYQGDDGEDDRYRIFQISAKESEDGTILEALALSEGAPRFETRSAFVEFLSSTSSRPWFNAGLTFQRVQSSKTS